MWPGKKDLCMWKRNSLPDMWKRFYFLSNFQEYQTENCDISNDIDYIEREERCLYRVEQN
jgi:hypothetical protein